MDGDYRQLFARMYSNGYVDLTVLPTTCSLVYAHVSAMTGATAVVAIQAPSPSPEHTNFEPCTSTCEYTFT